MENYYTVNQIMHMTGLSDSHVRKTLRKKNIQEEYTYKREKYYAAEDIDRVFAKYYYRMDGPEHPDAEEQVFNQIVLTRTDYDKLVSALGLMRGKLEEMERSREYWERERKELRDRIDKLESLIELYHQQRFDQ